jgi:hypothetical protein
MARPVCSGEEGSGGGEGSGWRNSVTFAVAGWGYALSLPTLPEGRGCLGSPARTCALPSGAGTLPRGVEYLLEQRRDEPVTLVHQMVVVSVEGDALPAEPRQFLVVVGDAGLLERLVTHLEFAQCRTPGHEEAGDDEEHVYPDKAATEAGHAEVVQHHDGDREGAQCVDVLSEKHEATVLAHGSRTGCRTACPIASALTQSARRVQTPGGGLQAMTKVRLSRPGLKPRKLSAGSSLISLVLEMTR